MYVAMPIRVREQRVKRAEHVQRVCSFLAKPLRHEEHQKRIHGTNRLFPHGSLKRQALRCLFGGWVRKHYGKGKGRVFTKTLAKDVCMELREQFGLGAAPDQEVCRLQALLAYARKRRLKTKVRSKNQGSKAMSLEDISETVPMEMEARSFFVRLNLSFSFFTSNAFCRRAT